MRYRAPICPACGYAAVDRRYMDWHYGLDRRCSQMDLDSVEIDYRTGAWLALIETTVDPGKKTYWTEAGARGLSIPAYLVILPAGVPLGPMTHVRIGIIHWPSDEPRPFTGCNGETLLRTWGRYIEQRIHGLPPKLYSPKGEGG